MKSIAYFLVTGFIAWNGWTHASAAESRDEKVRNDRSTVNAGGLWIYNNLDQALLEARHSNKPLLVTFRCIP